MAEQTKPFVEPHLGPTPDELVIEDLVIGTGTEIVRSSTDTRSAKRTVLAQAPVNADHHFSPAYPASYVCRAMACVIMRS